MRENLDGSMKWPILCNTEPTPQGRGEVRTQICRLGEERREGILFFDMWMDAKSLRPLVDWMG